MNSPRHLWQTEEKFRFLVIGAINTAVGYLLFLSLYLAAGSWMHYLLVALTSHFLATCIAYTLQRTIVFRSSSPIVPEFIRFNLSLVAVLLAGMAGLSVLVSGVGLSPPFAQIIVMAVTVAGNYLAHRHFSFRGKK